MSTTPHTFFLPRYVHLTSGCMARAHRTVIEKVIPYQERVLRDEVPDAPSHAIENFRIAAGESSGEFRGMVFQDSDVAKWLEATAYSLMVRPDPDLERRADEVISLIGKAQLSDGYLNTYFILTDIEKRWTNLAECHELYCAGHMLEAAVAYYQATGKRELLDIMLRFVDHIDSRFGPEEGKLKGYPGHQEIELALLKLYELTGEKRHLDLASFFIEERGRQPHYFEWEWETRGRTSFWPRFRELGHEYSQSHIPVRAQREAVGHAVRAMYMYTALADLARITGDTLLWETAQALWKDVTRRKMYVTGGIGASAFGESFSIAYDLPNDRAYNETCASIGLFFWASRMLRNEIDSEYSDVMELALYNGILSGMSLDGSRFFYVNPLEVWPEACRHREDLRHVMTTRQKWFGCACCPPNLARLLASIGGYYYSRSDSSLFVHLYGSSNLTIEDWGVTVEQETEYPWDGEVKLSVIAREPREFTLSLRIPGWCNDFLLEIDGKSYPAEPERGYVSIRRIWHGRNTVILRFPMPVMKIYASPAVRENVGKIALKRGPVIYCLEEMDNGKDLQALAIKRDSSPVARYESSLLDGLTTITAEGVRLTADDSAAPYQTTPPTRSPAHLVFIPYYAWNNRGEGEMRVWIREE